VVSGHSGCRRQMAAMRQHRTLTDRQEHDIPSVLGNVRLRHFRQRR
jgi:hypothetical protein